MNPTTTATYNKSDSTLVLKNKALLVKLYRKKISRNKTDKKLSEYVTQEKQVKKAGMVRVQKTLFPKDITDKYQKVITDCGKYFYRVTTPWDDKGYRLLSIEMYKTFTKEIKKYTTQFRNAVEGFAEHLQSSIDEMKAELGEAFELEDYKDLFNSDGTVNRDYILSLFNLDVEYNNVTDADDIRASLTEEDREILAEHITKNNNEKFTKSMEHVAYQLFDAVKAIHTRLSNQENIFRDSLIGNLEELCDILPALNIAGDQNLNDLAAEARNMLCTWAPQTLRDEPEKRKEVADKAAEIIGKMQGMI